MTIKILIRKIRKFISFTIHTCLPHYLLLFNSGASVGSQASEGRVGGRGTALTNGLVQGHAYSINKVVDVQEVLANFP